MRINTVKFIRKAVGFEQTELAAFLGVSVSTISRMECGKYKPSKRFRSALESKLGITDRDLVEIHFIHENIRRITAELRRNAGLDQ